MSFVPAFILVTSSNPEFCLMKDWLMTTALVVLQGAGKVEAGVSPFLCLELQTQGTPLRPVGLKAGTSFAPTQTHLTGDYWVFTAHQLLFLNSHFWGCPCDCAPNCVSTDTVKNVKVRGKLLLCSPLRLVPCSIFVTVHFLDVAPWHPDVPPYIFERPVWRTESSGAPPLTLTPCWGCTGAFSCGLLTWFIQPCIRSFRKCVILCLRWRWPTAVRKIRAPLGREEVWEGMVIHAAPGTLWIF